MADMQGPGRDTELDVVIATRDRPADKLAACLGALWRQSFEHFGVIVVDDGSRDPVVGRVEESHPTRRIRVIRNAESVGPAASRNRGVALSDAPYVLFIDDDCISHPELVARHHAALRRAAGSVVSLGPILSPPGRRLPPWTHWDADRLGREYARLGRGESTSAWTHCYTGNLAVRRADFRAVGGFDERLARQEDIELGFRLFRLGRRFAFSPDAIVWHDSDRTLRRWTRIPALSAHFDVLIDQLVPDSQRLSSVREGLRHRHWLLRLARRVCRPPAAHRCVVTGAIGAGCLLHVLHADRPSLAAFSLVWDLEYTRALAEATSTSPERLQPASPRYGRRGAAGGEADRPGTRP
ncbi:exopolysaccharide biosynthesis glycosyltransferase EpsD [Streptomyces albicerus]|uniref:exopolysaccharide biosynthesis glycosyltransferase EpsD n=1 Tax=Streptomyces albicerus TaxID=2569859 RepID=UPI001788A36B|nr:exopolysaccharide biosynthesis glycosyltransferase EpsD [Streptomyces albicerus]